MMSDSTCVFTVQGAVDKKGARGWIIKKWEGQQPISAFGWTLGGISEILTDLKAKTNGMQPYWSRMWWNMLLSVDALNAAAQRCCLSFPATCCCCWCHTLPPTCAALSLSSYCVATVTRENKASDHTAATVTTVTSNLCFNVLQDVCKTCTWGETETHNLRRQDYGIWSGDRPKRWTQKILLKFSGGLTY